MVFLLRGRALSVSEIWQVQGFLTRLELNARESRSLLFSYCGSNFLTASIYSFFRNITVEKSDESALQINSRRNLPSSFLLQLQKPDSRSQWTREAGPFSLEALFPAASNSP